MVLLFIVIFNNADYLYSAFKGRLTLSSILPQHREGIYPVSKPKTEQNIDLRLWVKFFGHFGFKYLNSHEQFASDKWQLTEN